MVNVSITSSGLKRAEFQNLIFTFNDAFNVEFLSELLCLVNALVK